ncbi:MAG TPA: DUF933 domain-containing protein [Candidatus Omnitrophota bacterium]|nr:DUF933 domain-containing protein [Candidatus Omnitrophota bacterium]HPT07010.1 DUF933 domain-containing protein [Candidatus Omnitrophota bacterium]
MKVCVFAIAELQPGKKNVKDSRLDQADSFVKAKKRTYIQIDLVGEDKILEADSVLILKENRTDLILADLDFVETRLSRATEDNEKNLLSKMKASLEKEEFLSTLTFTDAEKALMASYNIVTHKPVVLAEKAELENENDLLSRAVKESGYTSFFTVGDKETRAWLIKKGTTAHEAAGAIHSDIQKGFIRAEIIGFDDYMKAGGEVPAKQAGKLHSEQKEYIMQDCDIVNFRFNK